MATGEVRVLQWNIWYKENIRDVLGYLKSMPGGTPQVLCLQELTDDYAPQSYLNTWQYLADGLGYFMHVDTVPVIGLQENWTQAVAIFSMYKMTHTYATKIHTPQDPLSPHDQYRSYAEATIATAYGEFTVGTAHNSVADPFAATTEKQREIANIERHVRDRRRYSFQGDINAGYGSAMVTMLDRNLQHAGPDWHVPSWPTKIDPTEAMSQPYLDRRLDVSYVSHDVDVISAEAVVTPVSDHSQLVTDIKFSDKP